MKLQHWSMNIVMAVHPSFFFTLTDSGISPSVHCLKNKHTMQYLPCYGPVNMAAGGMISFQHGNTQRPADLHAATTLKVIKSRFSKPSYSRFPVSIFFFYSKADRMMIPECKLLSHIYEYYFLSSLVAGSPLELF